MCLDKRLLLHPHLVSVFHQITQHVIHVQDPSFSILQVVGLHCRFSMLGKRKIPIKRRLGNATIVNVHTLSLSHRFDCNVNLLVESLEFRTHLCTCLDGFDWTQWGPLHKSKKLTPVHILANAYDYPTISYQKSCCKKKKTWFPKMLLHMLMCQWSGSTKKEQKSRGDGCCLKPQQII